MTETHAKPATMVGSIEGSDAGNLALPLAGILLRSVIIATAWTLYLSKSKRVRATYGSVLPDVDVQQTAL